MSVAIKINEEFYNSTKPIAKAQLRSIPNQIIYWARIGRNAIENPDLPVDFIIGVLEALDDEAAGEKPTPFEFEGKK